LCWTTATLRRSEGGDGRGWPTSVTDDAGSVFKTAGIATYGEKKELFVGSLVYRVARTG